jgi:nucleoside-diphosphate-sugar epimerase
MRVLVTGASGFIGKSLVRELKFRKIEVIEVSRNKPEIDNKGVFTITDFNAKNIWQQPLVECDVVIHLAALVHQLGNKSKLSLSEYLNVNLDATVNLANEAVKAGVKRFVFVSTIGVNGASGTVKPFVETDLANPHNHYAFSKMVAEKTLYKISIETGMEVVIVRPPLVYGVGVKGNFAQMLKILTKGILLPFASVKNLRSFIYVENLVDALILCATHPSAVGQTYLVSDGQDISTPDLLRKLSRGMNKPVKLIPCSPVFMSLAGRVIGKSDQLDKLVSSLQVDSSKIRRELGWKPPFTLDEGLKATVEAMSEK